MYNKIFTKITDSSVWMEDIHTRLVWVMFLAIMDEDGFVELASVKNVAHKARIDLDKAQEAIRVLEGPDPDSSNPANEGRRIERVPGGWMILNAGVYRDTVRREDVKKQTRERVRNFRAKKECNAGVTPCNAHVTVCNDLVTPSEAEAEAELDVTKCARANVQFEKIELHTPSRQEDFIGPPRTGRYVPSDPVGDYPREVAEQAREIFQKFCMHHYGNVKSLHNDKQQNEIRHFAGVITTGGYEKLKAYFVKPPLETKSMEAFQLLDHLGLRKPVTPTSSAATEELKRKMLEEMNNIGRMS